MPRNVGNYTPGIKIIVPTSVANSLLTEVFLSSELEWQLLLSFIRETVSICPQTFVSSICRSSTMPDKEHGELTLTSDNVEVHSSGSS